MPIPSRCLLLALCGILFLTIGQRGSMAQAASGTRIRLVYPSEMQKPVSKKLLSLSVVRKKTKPSLSVQISVPTSLVASSDSAKTYTLTEEQIKALVATEVTALLKREQASSAAPAVSFDQLQQLNRNFDPEGGLQPYYIPAVAHAEDGTFFSANNIGAGAFSGGSMKIDELEVKEGASIAGGFSASLEDGIHFGLTPGSVVFQGSDGLAQDNEGLYYNTDKKFLGIGTASPASQLSIVGSPSFATSAVSGIEVADHEAVFTGEAGSVYGSLYGVSLGMVTASSSVSGQTIGTMATLHLKTPGAAPAGIAITQRRVIDTETGAHLTLGGAWTNASSRALKENFTPVDADEVLRNIDRLSITRWNYRTESPSTTHIGPTAEDFYKAFELGGTAGRTSISTIDPAGVALAAIQALSKKLAEPIEWLANALNALGVSIKEGMMKVADLEVGSREVPSGLTVYDRTTRQPYCLGINNGALDIRSGSCAAAASLEVSSVVLPISETLSPAPPLSPPMQTEEAPTEAPTLSLSEETAPIETEVPRVEETPLPILPPSPSSPAPEAPTSSEQAPSIPASLPEAVPTPEVVNPSS